MEWISDKYQFDDPNVREEWVEEMNCNVGGCISMLRKSWIAYKIAKGKGYVQMILYK